MSTSEPAATGDGSFVEHNSGASQTTQPSEELLNALAAIQQSQASQEPPPPPPSEYDVLKRQLSENPHNPDGWRRLVSIAESGGDLATISATYEALLEQYPNTAAAQIQYITHHINSGNMNETKDLFKKWLMKSPCVELWSYYLTYIRRINASPNLRDVVKDSYDFALNRIGHDKDSGSMWNDYIQFLKAGEASGTWEEQQKMDSLRKVYHRAVQIPLDNVERLWQDLEAFETNLNKITAKKFMADLSPAHMQARTVLRQLVNHLGPLYASSSGGSSSSQQSQSFSSQHDRDRDMYLPSLPRFDAHERALVGKWKAYLKWEESNPLEIEDKDKSTLIMRIQSVYRKALIRMRYYTEIWFMAYTWTNSVGKQEEAMGILKAGIEANPSSYLLTFAYAEALEAKKEFAEVNALYDKFLGILKTNLEALEQTTANSANTSLNSNADPKANVPSNVNPSAPGAAVNPGDAASQSSQSLSASTIPDEFTQHRTQYGLAWIMYLRFARRAEGAKAGRAVLTKARKERLVPWQVYEAAALMEYHNGEKGVAIKIFELKLDVFGDEIDFVLRYLGFLISINDSNNARALFERMIPNFAPDKARPLWERWARYVYQYGDLDASLKLEKRMADVYPSDPPIKRLAQRHIYLGTDAIADHDLGLALARKNTGSSASNASQAPSAPTGPAAGASQAHLPAHPHASNAGHPHSNGAGNGYGPIHGPGGSTSQKRAASPGDYRAKRDDGRGLPGGGAGAGGDYKRMRVPSPHRGGDRDREMRDARDLRDRDGPREGKWGDAPRPPPGSGGGGRRFNSPGPPPSSWDRDRERDSRDRDDRPGPSRGRFERDDDKRGPSVTLPPVLQQFMADLPSATSFDGPIFRTDDLMNLFRNAVIPSSNARPKSPPPAPRSARPPPDYGPYQGPNNGRRRY